MDKIVNAMHLNLSYFGKIGFIHDITFFYSYCIMQIMKHICNLKFVIIYISKIDTFVSAISSVLNGS